MIQGIVQGLAIIGGIVWAIVAALIMAACHPSEWDAPISRWWPWWCLVWPLLIGVFVASCVADMMGFDVGLFNRTCRLCGNTYPGTRCHHCARRERST